MSRKAPSGHICKVVMLGDAGSGKTCLLQRFLRDTFNAGTQPTIGAAFGTKILDSINGPVSLQIWDTAGQERYQALANLYYRGANAAVVCCDLTDLKTFQRMEYWIKQVQNAEKQCKIYVCGNKADLVWDGMRNRAITLDDLKIFKTTAMETSSKENYNVSTLFQLIVDELEPTLSAPIGVSPQRSLSLPAPAQTNNENRRKCC